MNSYQKNKISIEGVTKSFEDLLIVDDVSISLKEKEFVSILGPSGSGKSTIFNIISGLMKPDTGKVYIEGKEFTGKTGRVSYMYQKDLLLPWKKIIDNVSIPLVIKGETMQDARKKVKKYFEIFGLEGFEDKYPHQLSGGMRQRASLLRTYMFSKDIILLDEPFGGLDAITKSKMQSWLLEILDKLEASIFFITHDIEEAIYLSDRIYILSDRPAVVKEEIKINLPKPRHEDIVTTHEFNEIKKHILNLL
ncbi:ABC transporter ATP-binding protein [Clostridium sp. D2Q-11]|uniref:ABC transporter ATP-binding protein n=1 Tax=Anaeromonas frigoriresistens TaxID=2683708 RepID=A0A942UX71_9FIRM|nr:ABC transporter ATP-binding protein [Anaeromonas frigoriresistens]MBS4537267.1 ABC transporter ATP-binding protein [Anaeromonas frigoriresistens]